MAIFAILCNDFLWTLSFIYLLHIFFLNGKRRHNRYLLKKQKVEDIMIPFFKQKRWQQKHHVLVSQDLNVLFCCIFTMIFLYCETFFRTDCQVPYSRIHMSFISLFDRTLCKWAYTLNSLSSKSLTFIINNNTINVTCRHYEVDGEVALLVVFTEWLFSHKYTN